MNDFEILLAKTLLRILHDIGAGLPERPLMDQVELSVGRPVTTVDRKLALDHAMRQGWIYSYKNALTGVVCYSISDEGKIALSGL